jgi:hypothetical protein
MSRFGKETNYIEIVNEQVPQMLQKGSMNLANYKALTEEQRSLMGRINADVNNSQP